MSAEEKKVIFASSLGTVFEWYDFYLYGSLAAIKIDPQALNPSDAQIVEDMILTATNQALAQAKEISTAEMGKVTAGMSLPGLGGM